MVVGNSSNTNERVRPLDASPTSKLVDGGARGEEHKTQEGNAEQTVIKTSNLEPKTWANDSVSKLGEETILNDFETHASMEPSEYVGELGAKETKEEEEVLKIVPDKKTRKSRKEDNGTIIPMARGILHIVKEKRK